MILYFSGTGNSKYIAEGLSYRLGDVLISINDKIRNNDNAVRQYGGQLVIVFPVYVGRIPKLVEQWITGTHLRSQPVYFIGTCSHIAGNIEPYLRALARKKHLRYMGFLPIFMPQNHICIYPHDKAALERRKLSTADRRTEYAHSVISQQKHFPKYAPTPYEYVLSGLEYAPFYRFMVGAKKFRVTDKCVGCGLCEMSCLLNNVKILNRRPCWGNSCTHCMACIGRCPQKAIEYGSITLKRKKYHCKGFDLKKFEKGSIIMFDKKILDSIEVLFHSSIRISGDKVIYIDPFKISGERHDADLILLTHDHFDHFSKEDIAKVMNGDTVIAAPELMADECRQIVGDRFISVLPDKKYTVCGIEIETVPAYNIVKPFHPKSKKWVGYIMTIGGTRVYVAGDTDMTDENKCVSCDIALVPIGGTYTMNAKKAAAFTNIIRPHTVIPIHYGSVVGKPEDAEVFKSAVDKDIEVRVLL